MGELTKGLLQKNQSSPQPNVAQKRSMCSSRNVCNFKCIVYVNKQVEGEKWEPRNVKIAESDRIHPVEAGTGFQMHYILSFS